MIVRTFEGLQAFTTPPPLTFAGGSSSSLNLYGLNQAYAEIYKTQPNVRICVDFLARNIAELTFQVYRRISDTDRARLHDHDLARWLGTPNPATRRYRLIENLMGDLGIYFNGNWMKVRYVGADGRDALGLVRIPADQIRVAGGLLPSHYVWRANGREKDIPLSELVYFGGYNPTNPLMGLSPLETLRRILAEEASAGDYREGLWRNAARHEGVVTRPKDVKRYTEAQAQSWREQWQAAHAGGVGTGKTILLQDGETFTPTSFSPKDSEYIAGGKLRREVCAAAYHIPQPLVGILEHATFCLPADAEVFTEDGPRAIADVRVGDNVWSLANDGEWALQAVRRSGRTGYDPILTVCTSNRTLRLNARHRVLVRRAEDVPAPVAVMGDGYRRAVGRATKVWQSIYVPASDLIVGDTLVTLRHLPMAGTDAAPSGRQLTDGFMALCGLLIGDGNISRQNGTLTGLQFARDDHATYMDAYRGFMREAFTRRGNRPITLAEGYRQTRFASTTAADEMALLGFSGTARTKRVPGWVFHATEPLRLAFVRGFLDADGSVDKKGRCSFHSCNRVMLSQMRHLCMSLCVPVTNLRCQRGETKLPNGRMAAFENWTFTTSDPGANRRIGSHTPEYVRRFEAGQPFGRKARRYPWHGGRGFTPGAVDLAMVRSIETSAIAQPVYDLDVAETHNFIAEGVVVHNSNIKEQHKHLYQDTLGPWLRMLKEEIEGQLLIECDDQTDVYGDFNIDAKLAGTPEERAASLSLSIGRPWRTVNEGRALENLPRIDDPDMDTVAPQQGGPATNSQSPADQPTDQPPAGMTRTAPGADGVAPVLQAARLRQQARLTKLPAVERASAFFADRDRWLRELTADLTPLVGAEAAADLAVEAIAATFQALDAEEAAV